jgi:hypothetical protein
MSSRFEELDALVGQNVLEIPGLQYYKGCINEDDISVEMYKNELGYLVATDNIVVSASTTRRHALSEYNSWFD